MGMFGWSLPAGCDTLPGEEKEFNGYHCPNCGAFLPYNSDRTEDCVDKYVDADGNEQILGIGTLLIWDSCNKCHKEARINIG